MTATSRTRPSSAAVRDSRVVQLQCRETPAGRWIIAGLSINDGALGDFATHDRALEHLLELVGPLPAWEVAVVNHEGQVLEVFNSDDDAMHWHVK